MALGRQHLEHGGDVVDPEADVVDPLAPLVEERRQLGVVVGRGEELDVALGHLEQRHLDALVDQLLAVLDDGPERLAVGVEGGGQVADGDADVVDLGEDGQLLPRLGGRLLLVGLVGIAAPAAGSRAGLGAVVGGRLLDHEHDDGHDDRGDGQDGQHGDEDDAAGLVVGRLVDAAGAGDRGPLLVRRGRGAGVGRGRLGRGRGRGLAGGGGLLGRAVRSPRPSWRARPT